MKQSILVIDDDASLRRVLEFTLQEEGYHVITAASGEEGLERFAKEKPAVVITDVRMPGINGYQVLKSIKERTPSTVVIIITAFGVLEEAVEAMKQGAFDYLTKPFDREALKTTLRRALAASAQRNARSIPPPAADRKIRVILGESPAMKRVLDVVERVADTEATVLITGESGTGKELVADRLHQMSSRRKGPFVAVNCAAIARELLESELFGHVKGAFTGAIRDKQGKFQLAQGGTLFLDEVGEMPYDLQSKLLRALQEKVVDPVGSTHPIRLDVRLVAATNRDLEKAVAEGVFRRDLFYRLSVIPIEMPPLRDCREDIPLLVRHFLSLYGGDSVSMTADAVAMLSSYDWPGNVRELENAVERLVILRKTDQITLADLPEKIRTGGSSHRDIVNLPPDGYPLEKLEKDIVIQALERNNWNQTAAARFLSIPRHVLIYRMEKYGIAPAKKTDG
jgi:two-component system NtrC family response regulator